MAKFLGFDFLGFIFGLGDIFLFFFCSRPKINFFSGKNFDHKKKEEK